MKSDNTLINSFRSGVALQRSLTNSQPHQKQPNPSKNRKLTLLRVKFSSTNILKKAFCSPASFF